MSLTRVAIRSFVHHWRTNLAVALGVVACCAVLTGALIVGDSVRGSLTHLAIERLGRIDTLVLADRFVDEDLAERVLKGRRVARHFRQALPVILIQDATVQLASANRPGRATGVTLIACTEGFWDQDVAHVRPDVLPRGRQIVLNEPLAQRLNARVGDRVVVYLEKISNLAADSTLVHKFDRAVSVAQLEVVAVIPASGLGRFSLRLTQQRPLSAFVALDLLQEALGQDRRINSVFLSTDTPASPAPSEATLDVRQGLALSLDDAGIMLTRVVQSYQPAGESESRVAFEYLNVSTVRMFFSSAAEQTIARALAGVRYQQALTYLANAIYRVGPDGKPLGPTQVPYSTITAIDPHPTLGPWVGDSKWPAAPLAADEIVLNSWTAEQLGAEVGDTIGIDFFEPDSADAQPHERSQVFTLRGIVDLVQPQRPYSRRGSALFDRRPSLANDPYLTPQVPGITDEASIQDWDPPFPFDYRRIRRPEDEDYWDNYRTTPKAFIALAAGRSLWRSRFGRTTSFRIPLADRLGEAEVRARLLRAVQENPEAFGFRVTAVKRDGLDASKGTTPFAILFLIFSLFIIVSALLLVALLFRLNVERRASQTGLLLAVGWNHTRIARLYLIEGLLICAGGAAVGAGVGVAYAWLMILGLTAESWWLAAVGTPFLELFVRPTSVAIGACAGAVVAALVIVFAPRAMQRFSVRWLLSGQTERPVEDSASFGRWRLALAALLLVAAVGLAVWGQSLGSESQAAAFFGCAASVLVALWLATSWWLRRLRSRSRGRFRWGLSSLVVRNLARHPGRTTMTMGLVASACFVIVAVGAFRLSPTERGTGGFTLVGESDRPVFEDPNAEAFRSDLTPQQANALRDTRVVRLRVRDGEDASCRNLYQTQQPRILGVTPDLVTFYDRHADMGFQWAATADDDKQQNNPWRLLDTAPTAATDPVPVVLDKNTAMYSLHLNQGVGEEFSLDYGADGIIRFRVVGLLSNSVLQGNLLVGERRLLDRFPTVSGYRFFLIDCPDRQREHVSRTFEQVLSQQGMTVRRADQLLQDLLAVQNTYLSTFQTLAGLGLLLGTLGLTAVQLRNVWERRKELALLTATGFNRRRLSELVLAEQSLIMGTGMAMGLVAALFAVLPHWLSGRALTPLETLAGLLLLIALVGILSGLVAVRDLLARPVLASLRSE